MSNNVNKIALRSGRLLQVRSCPFCGGDSVLTKSSKTIIKGELTYVTYCYCKQCNSRGRRYILGDDKQKAHESAVNSWNRRYEDEIDKY